jgi:DNA-binding Lrp family transcriptional regulator
LIEKLRLLPGVVAIVEHVGNSMYVISSCRDIADEERQISLIQKLAGAKSSHFIRAQFPNCKLRLSSTDGEIIRVLAEDPRKKLTEVAQGVGVSSKTVKRRMDRLIEGKAMFVVPSMDPSMLEGALLVDLLVEYSNQKNLSKMNQRILPVLGDYLIRATGDPGGCLFNLIITRVSSIREVLSQVRSMAGVASARIDIVQDRLELYGQYPEPLQEKPDL